MPRAIRHAPPLTISEVLGDFNAGREGEFGDTMALSMGGSCDKLTQESG
jgi:hypothetical protein